jgi:hypothetical protein
MIAAAIAILIGVYVAATGRGGELAYEHADHAPLDLGPVSATDIAMLRPPTALWGYNIDVTDEALGRIARAVRERDITIAYLQSRLADQRSQTASLSPAAETAWLSPAPEAASPHPDGETTSSEPSGQAAEDATDATDAEEDGALAPEEQPW